MHIDQDLRIFTPRIHTDDRGHFFEAYKEQDFNRWLGRPVHFIQENESVSGAWTVRGLHYQLPPRAQSKLVRVVHGVILDVAVDIRRSSPTFGEWRGFELGAENNQQLWIPEGFAHGFMALIEGTRVLYKTSEVYSPDHERAIRWDDPAISIGWPLARVTPRLSEKDAHAPTLAQAEVFK